MVELRHIYVVLFAIATVIALVLTVLAWHHRSTRGARPLVLATLGIAIWCGASAAMWSAHTLTQQVFWIRSMALGVWMVPVGFLTLALDVAGISRWRTPARTALIAIPPFVLANIQWWNPGGLYHAAFVAHEIGTRTHYFSIPGPLYWVFVAYAYAMLLLGMALIIRVYRRSPATQRARPAMLLVGAGVPFVASIVTESRLIPLNSLDLAPLAFLVTGTLWFVSLSRGELLDILPLARHAVVEQMSDGVIVLDHDDRVTDANPAALKILRMPPDIPVGEPAQSLLGGVPGAVSSLRKSTLDDAGEVRQAAMPIGCTDDCRYVDYRITALDSGSFPRPAHLVMLHDVTEERRNTKLLQAANRELAINHERIETLNELLREETIRDPLTGLYNRRFLDESVPREIARSQRENVSLAFLLLDIDDFKRINDECSHAAGDAALKMVGGVLLAGARAADIVCRYGGDEFLVVMVNADTDDARSRADSLRSTIEASSVEWNDGSCPLTVSIGVSSLPACGVSADAGIAAADAALYAAKDAGRNSVSAALQREGSWDSTTNPIEASDETPPA